MSLRRASGPWKELAHLLRKHRALWRIGPARTGRSVGWKTAALRALRKPIGTPPLAELAKGAKSVVILADDMTRPTPQRKLLPPLLDELNAAGVRDSRITVIIALGTHRYMTKAEIRAHFGEAVPSRVRVINHAWKDPATFVDLGVTPRGTPIKVNRLAHEADLLIGVGSIVPHIYAGWGGGAKILMPGICPAEAIGPVHSLAAAEGKFLEVAGRSGTLCRREIEEVAELVGLDFILNVVLDADGACAWAGAGRPAQTHAAGVNAAESVLVREVPRPADIVVIDARPADIEYWQGIKALAHAARSIRRGGTAILVGGFPEGVETTHPDFSAFALLSEDEIVEAWRSGEIRDEVAVAPLRLHALALAHCSVICVSPGISKEDKQRLGFAHAESIGDALDQALAEHGSSAAIGVIECGGDVVPRPSNRKRG